MVTLRAGVVGLGIGGLGLAGLIGAAGALLHAAAQQPVIHSQMRHARGQAVVPIYEGWFEDGDGVVHASYGYVNLNLDEALDVPIGAGNAIEPGPADRGQPTHFLAGHQKGVFTVPLPAGTASGEISWTLSVRGQTTSIPSNLGALYQIEGLVANGGPFPGNTPPVLRFRADGAHGQGPAGLTRGAAIETTAASDTPLDLWITDDGLPGDLDPLVIRSLQSGQRMRGGRRLSVEWTKYRGPGDVRFSDPSPPIEDGAARTTARFTAPGAYVLRVLASDGSGLNGCCWTNGYVHANVE